MPLINLKLLSYYLLSKMLQTQKKKIQIRFLTNKKTRITTKSSAPTKLNQTLHTFNSHIITIVKTENYLVNKTSTTELCGEAVPENLIKPFLVMVIPISTRIIHTPNIKHSIKTLQYLQPQNQFKHHLHFT